MTPSAIVVADAGAEAGLGHVSRSGAIAVALACRGLSVRCFALGAEKPLTRDGMEWTPIMAPHEIGYDDADVAVFDSYRTTGDEMAELGRERPLVVLHDWTEPARAAALVVSASGDGDAADERRLYGLQYACLRPSFWGLPRRAPGMDVRRVVVATGAGDASGEGTKLSVAARTSVPGARVRLVAGPYARPVTPEGVEVVRGCESLLDEFLAADLAISGGGQTLLEAVASGTPTAAVEIAENQRRQIRQLEAAGAVEPVEAPAGARRVLQALANDSRRRIELAARGQDAVDGYGALRVAYRIARLVAHADRGE